MSLLAASTFYQGLIEDIRTFLVTIQHQGPVRAKYAGNVDAAVELLNGYIAAGSAADVSAQAVQELTALLSAIRADGIVTGAIIDAPINALQTFHQAGQVYLDGKPVVLQPVSFEGEAGTLVAVKNASEAGEALGVGKAPGVAPATDAAHAPAAVNPLPAGENTAGEASVGTTAQPPAHALGQSEAPAP